MDSGALLTGVCDEANDPERNRPERQTDLTNMYVYHHHFMLPIIFSVCVPHRFTTQVFQFYAPLFGHTL